MKLFEARRRFIDRTARKPSGRCAIHNYSDPKAHYRSFRNIMKSLNLSKDDTYCEIGCGGGVLLGMALSKARQGVAIDHSDDMVSTAILKNREFVDADKLEILQGNAENLPWKDESFTACASANMFFFVEKPQDMLNEVHRVLKPQGRFSMVTMGKGLLGKITFGWLYGLRTYTDKEMTSMFEKAGLVNIKIKTGFFGVRQACYGEK